MSLVVARIKGGLGNQLFCYAAARRLAVANGAELVLDAVTGFSRDFRFKRQYALHNFDLPCRLATPAERLEPFVRLRRAALKRWQRGQPFERRSFIQQEGNDFDARLLTLPVKGVVRLDGYWQSERYFADASETIRSDLSVKPLSSPANVALARQIAETTAVAIHVRWFDGAGPSEPSNAEAGYYRRAIDHMDARFPDAQYFLFSDDTRRALEQLGLPPRRVTPVEANPGDAGAFGDLSLMATCRHFITANSTFSWWGAWLGRHPEKVVIAPKARTATWGFEGQLPDEWLKI